MRLFELTLGKIFDLIERLIQTDLKDFFVFFKPIVYFLSLTVTGLLLFIWIKLEIKNKDEIGFWKDLIKNAKDFFFLKKTKTSFEEIKKTFHQNKLQGLIEIDNFLNLVLEKFGYEGNLKEKLEKIDKKILPSIEEVKKAVEIIEILKEKRDVELSDDEYLMIFHQYEIALEELNILTKEDFLVNYPK